MKKLSDGLKRMFSNKLLVNITLSLSIFTLISGVNLTIGQSAQPASSVQTSDLSWTPVKYIDFSSKHDVMIKNDDGSLTPMDVPYYKATLIAPGTWQILSDGDYLYMVEGDSAVLVIDSGYGAGNIREYCQSLTTKPVKYVVNTHYHFDHTANNAYFDCVYMSAETKSKATMPSPSFTGIIFPRDYPTVIIGEGYKFHLGNRELEVFEIPNHAVGSIALLDRRERILFSGDEVLGDGIRISGTVAQFERNMSKIATYRSEYDRLCAGEGIKDASDVDKYLANARYILSGKGTTEKTQPSALPAKVTADPSATVIYLRRTPRTVDRGQGSSNATIEFAVKMTYAGCTISYDSRRINE